MAPRRINHPEPGHLLAGPFPVIILKTWESPGAITQQYISEPSNCQQKKTTKSGEEAFIKTFMLAVEIVE